ncbi:ABC transporter substrate-binding protein [Scatolibacter rhodanostii]|uniref:ABC transporter substrate-binding protein n=1 Tax=Scatolibacter rhodanostii TaxID=2014781 RepID=UPI000C077C53|nr:ABC transporter substrate-binding protein [Scatolibacter rhodanostii]
MKKWIATVLSMIMLTGALSACTNAGEASSSLSSTVSQQESVASEESKTSSVESVSTEEESVWPRTILDAAGNEVVLEKKPERVSLVHIVYLEHLLALGAPPTAAALGNAQGDVEALEQSELLSPYLKDTEIAMLGNSKNLSVEAVLESQPDVIVTFYNPAGFDQYEQLAEIAPVIQISYTDTWQDQLRVCAQVLGLEEKAETLIADTEKKIEETKTTLAPYADKTFALFRTDGKSFIAQGMSQFYTAFGITKPEGFTDKADSLSLETVAEMNPDYIVFQHNYEVAKAFVDSMESNSVWQALDAVKNGQVYYFDENMNSYGPLSMNLGADKIVEIYTK